MTPARFPSYRGQAAVFSTGLVLVSFAVLVALFHQKEDDQ